MLGVSVQAWFSHDDVSVAPGESVTLPLTVHNLDESTESYTIVPAGLAASWTTVGRGNLTLFGGSQEVIDVTIAPPPLPTTSAGPTAIAIRIIPLGDSDDAIVAESTVAIEPFDDCHITPLQPVLRARHRGTFEFMVENRGNTVATCRLHLVDPTDRVDGDFDPPAIGVAPGGSSLVRLKARAQRGVFRRATRTLDFEVEAARQGHDPVSAPLAFVQSPTIPGSVLVKTLAVLATIAALVLAWFGVVKPTIEDAARDEVDRIAADLAPTGSAPAPGASTTVPDSGAGNGEGGDAGESEWVRLSVAASLTQTADQTYTVPSGQYFDLSDVRVGNPFDDRGVATLMVNTEPLFVWSLANVRGSAFEPRLTPIRIQPGDNLTFAVRCDEIGDVNRQTCTNDLLLIGHLVPVDG